MEEVPNSFRPDKDLEGKTKELMEDNPIHVLEKYNHIARKAYDEIIKFTISEGEDYVDSLIYPQVGIEITTNYVITLKILEGNQKVFDKCFEIIREEAMELFEQEMEVISSVAKKSVLQMARVYAPTNRRNDTVRTYSECHLKASKKLVELAKCYMKEKNGRKNT